LERQRATNPAYHGGISEPLRRRGQRQRVLREAEAEEEEEDLLPVTGERLGAAVLLSELRAGFRLLADPARGAITNESLRRGAVAAG
jgi:hypothetical protein